MSPSAEQANAHSLASLKALHELIQEAVAPFGAPVPEFPDLPPANDAGESSRQIADLLDALYMQVAQINDVVAPKLNTPMARLALKSLAGVVR